MGWQLGREFGCQPFKQAGAATATAVLLCQHQTMHCCSWLLAGVWEDIPSDRRWHDWGRPAECILGFMRPPLLTSPSAATRSLARVLLQDTLVGLMGIYGSTKTENVRASAASTLSRLLRSSPGMVAGVLDRWGQHLLLTGAPGMPGAWWWRAAMLEAVR